MSLNGQSPFGEYYLGEYYYGDLVVKYVAGELCNGKFRFLLFIAGHNENDESSRLFLLTKKSRPIEEHTEFMTTRRSLTNFTLAGKDTTARILWLGLPWPNTIQHLNHSGQLSHGQTRYNNAVDTLANSFMAKHGTTAPKSFWLTLPWPNTIEERRRYFGLLYHGQI